MIIVQADAALSRLRGETDAAWACHAISRMTSASALMFIQDSEGAGELAEGTNLDIGFYLNYERLTCPGHSKGLPVIMAQLYLLRRGSKDCSMFMKARRRRLIRIARMLITCDFLPLVYAVWVRCRRLEFSGGKYVSPENGFSHQHSGGPVLAKVIRSLAIPEGSVVLDLGVGTGMSALTLSRYFDLVIGVDLSPELIAAAKRNVARMGVGNIELHCADARAFNDGLDRVTHVYMFNPFPEAVVNVVLGNLRRSLSRAPRPLMIIYYYPTCHKAVVAAGFVHKRDFQFRHSHRFAIYEAGSMLSN
jgi:SAM-dependent methyltransferase